jgi:putative Holliday junction resolvase
VAARGKGLALNFSHLTPHKASTGTVLAFDFGTRRIGVAVGDLSLKLAHPLATISAEDNRTRFTAIERLIEEWQPVQLVVGLPTYPDGTEHEMSRLARRFAQRLEGRFGIAVALADERFSTHAADEALADAGVAARRRKPVIDQVAAGRILDAWFATLAA